MSKNENYDLSYLGFDWAEETEEAILNFFDEQLSCGGYQLPSEPETLTDQLCEHFGGSNAAEICSLYTQEVYEAVVSNMNLVTEMYDDWGTTLSNELNDRTLWESAQEIGINLQDYLINEFTNFSNEEYLDFTSSINPQVQVEGIQQAIIGKAENFQQQHKEDIKPIISNPYNEKEFENALEYLAGTNRDKLIEILPEFVKDKIYCNVQFDVIKEMVEDNLNYLANHYRLEDYPHIDFSKREEIINEVADQWFNANILSPEEGNVGQLEYSLDYIERNIQESPYAFSNLAKNKSVERVSLDNEIRNAKSAAKEFNRVDNATHIKTQERD